MNDNKDNLFLGRTTTLDVMLDALKAYETAGAADSRKVAGVTADSRAVIPDAVFVAVRGVAVDGHTFIDKAIAAGATTVVCEEIPAHTDANVLYVKVADSRDALGRLASRFYGDPSDELKLIGVTGTNGKTTIATLLYEVARLRDEKAGLISTVANIINGDSVPAEHTTPDPVQLNRLLRRMVDAGCTFASMEVSSHACDQHRISGLSFAGGIFTNLTRDHMDYHKTVEAYLKAKKSFFDGLPETAFALSNADDRNGEVMLQNTAAHKAYYSTRDVADFAVKVVEDRLDGMLLEIDGREVETMFVGRFNASNLAAVYGACVLSGIPADEAMLALSSLRPVTGRFQPVRSTEGVTAIIDYAHTPDALINVLDTIVEVAPEGAQVITVCGCGGNRDKGKRPLMARAAAERSDIVILTSDNPRNEKPEAILDDMLAGLDSSQLERTTTIVDRREAIRHAARIARPGDIILVAGKGHETEQIIGDQTRHFDDRQEVEAAFGLGDSAC
ncbi:MAG: UDP-N-acetylmuramoyl-L-alanyl-D-glutamate--2,6-diaminopimelate ligase [Muribaculaceae bacterium]|nr:UDP-N-acetylmuramoyl-L-alanyl-D-glutamate--2,6-diaminopimelate ligase [Muribaculaceae bacterium]